MLDLLLKVDDALAAVERRVAVAGLVALVALVAGKGVLRWAGHGLPWADELSGVLLLWVCFLGATLATRRRRHITVELLDRSLTPRARAAFGVASAVIALAFCGLLAGFAVGFIREQRASGTLTNVLKVPLWQVRLVLPLALSLFAWRFSLLALEDARALIRPDFPSPRHPAESDPR